MLTECPRCGCELEGHEKACPNCKKILVNLNDEAKGVGAKLTNCPVCKIPIYPAKMANHEILHCAECEGTAYKRETMMKLQSMDSKEVVIGVQERDHITPPFFEPREKPPFLVCPFCGKKMENKKMGPMQVDLCEKCAALWLDGQKFKHINEVLGPYKMAAMNKEDGGGRRRR